MEKNFRRIVSSILYFVISLTLYSITPAKAHAETNNTGISATVNKSAFEAARFISMDDDFNVTLEIDNEESTARLLNNVFDSSYGYDSVISMNSETVKNVNEALSGKYVFIEEDEIKTDDAGNKLVYLWIQKPENTRIGTKDFIDYCVNAAVVSQGLAMYNQSKLNTRYDKLFEVIQKDAMKNNLGIYNILDSESLMTMVEEYNTALGEPDIDLQKTFSTDNAIKNSTENTPLKQVESQESTKTKGLIQGNVNSKIYHVPGGQFYDKMNPENVIYFESEAEAQAAGYRKSKR